jgi:hypothetical protein
MIRVLALFSACVLFCIWLYRFLIGSPWFHQQVESVEVAEEAAEVIAEVQTAAKSRKSYVKKQQLATGEISKAIKTVQRRTAKTL